jgi:hypothetical protein
MQNDRDVLFNNFKMINERCAKNELSLKTSLLIFFQKKKIYIYNYTAVMK